jgi:hypothetical protein
MVFKNAATLLRHLPLTILLGVVGLSGVTLGVAWAIGDGSDVEVIGESRVLGVDAGSWRGMVREASAVAESDTRRRAWSASAEAFAEARAESSSGYAATAWRESAQLAARFEADPGVLAALVGNADRMGALAVGLVVMDDTHAMPALTETQDVAPTTEPDLGLTAGSSDGSQQSVRPPQG